MAITMQLGIQMTKEYKNGRTFLASKLAEPAQVVIRGVLTDIQCVGPQLVHVTILRLNPLVSDNDLAAALAPFGKVKTVQYLAFKGFLFVETGIAGLKWK